MGWFFVALSVERRFWAKQGMAGQISQAQPLREPKLGFNESPHSSPPTVAGARVQDKCWDMKKSRSTDDTSY